METPMIDYDFDRLKGLGWSDDFIEKMKDDPCWKGYQAVGMKTKGGRKVPNCVPVKKDAEHGEGDLATAEMTPNYLPKEPIPGGGDQKNPEMGEVGIRMPRMEEIKKANAKDGHLAMAAAPNYSETEDYSDRFYSDEPNGNMLITQLRVAREKIDNMLGMLYPDDNLEPWAATKIANAGVALASVADYLRFGGET
jgi:hypothetical protein